MHTLAVVLDKPRQVSLQQLTLPAPGESDVVVDIEWSGISTGTERLLWTGEMPAFPGMGYPLVPGYESVGRVSQAGSGMYGLVGSRVFVPGARCYGPVRGLFGGAASRVVVPGERVLPVSDAMGEQAVLLALAATAQHALSLAAKRHPVNPPDLIVGHGVLGRLLARLACTQPGGPPTVWETDPTRATGATGYTVLHPDADPHRDYHTICDVSGDAELLDKLVQRLAKGGEIVLAGFYTGRMSFAFAPAFMREVRLQIAAEWRPADLAAVTARLAAGTLALDHLITHRLPAQQAEEAYRTAFSDRGCLKMILDWRNQP